MKRRTRQLALALALLAGVQIPIHAGVAHAAPVTSTYIGNNDYLYVYSSAYTRYVATKWFRSLPSPDVSTICENTYIKLLTTLVSDLKVASYVCRAASYAYKAYAVRDWLEVRNDIGWAAQNSGCALYVWNSGTWWHGSRIHRAHVNGVEVSFIRYLRTAYIDTNWAGEKTVQSCLPA